MCVWWLRVQNIEAYTVSFQNFWGHRVPFVRIVHTFLIYITLIVMNGHVNSQGTVSAQFQVPEERRLESG